jgi:hypothetical protein
MRPDCRAPSSRCGPGSVRAFVAAPNERVKPRTVAGPSRQPSSRNRLFPGRAGLCSHRRSDGFRFGGKPAELERACWGPAAPILASAHILSDEPGQCLRQRSLVKLRRYVIACCLADTILALMGFLA